MDEEDEEEGVIGGAQSGPFVDWFVVVVLTTVVGWDEEFLLLFF